VRRSARRDPDGSSGRTATLTALLLAGALAANAGCERGGAGGPALPAAGQIEGLYGDQASVSLNGNVVDVRVEQGARQLRRGGPLWAKVGPYIFLFSPQTRQLLETYPGVAAVRVRTFAPSGDRIASVTLRRDALNAMTWDEAVRRVTRARTEGTEKPGYLEDLVEYGEDRTSFEYNPAYVER